MPEATIIDNTEQDPACTLATLFARVLKERMSEAASFAEHEREAIRLGNEVIRRALVERLTNIVADHGEGELLVNGKLHRLHSQGTVAYHSLVGALEVRRPSYRRAAGRNGPIVVPLELAAGLTERMTPAMAERVAHGHGECGSRALERQLLASGRVPPSRTTLQTLGKKIGGALATRRRAVAARVRRAATLPEGTRVLQLGLDRTAVPMEEDAPCAQPGTRKRPRVRKAPRPVEVHYRMAYIGTVAFVDGEREVLRTTKYSASAEEGPAAIPPRDDAGRSTCASSGSDPPRLGDPRCGSRNVEPSPGRARR